MAGFQVSTEEGRWSRQCPPSGSAVERRNSECQKGLEPFENQPPSRRPTELRVLTIRQPWAHAIIQLGKDVENRSWRANYKGRLLIHAAARQERDPGALLAEHMSRLPSQEVLDRLPTGAIVGVADVCDYVRDSDIKWASKGEWHWLLRDARPINPVPRGGQLGLWTPPASLMRRLPQWVRTDGASHNLSSGNRSGSSKMSLRLCSFGSGTCL
jgi:hypothetical protein